MPMRRRPLPWRTAIPKRVQISLAVLLVLVLAAAAWGYWR